MWKCVKKHKISLLVTKRGQKWIIIYSLNFRCDLYIDFMLHFHITLLWNDICLLVWFYLIFYAVTYKKTQNTVFGYKKGSKIDDNIFFWIFTYDLYIDFMLNFHIAILWNDLCQLVWFSLLFYAEICKNLFL